MGKGSRSLFTEAFTFGLDIRYRTRLQIGRAGNSVQFTGGEQKVLAGHTRGLLDLVEFTAPMDRDWFENRGE